MLTLNGTPQLILYKYLLFSFPLVFGNTDLALRQNVFCRCLWHTQSYSCHNSSSAPFLLLWFYLCTLRIVNKSFYTHKCDYL